MVLEMEAFPRWQKADEKGKEEIAKNLAEVEANMILAEIDEEVKKL